VQPFADLESDTMLFSSVLTFYQTISSDKAMRDAAEAIEKKFDDNDTDLSNNVAMFKALEKVKDDAQLTGSWHDLSHQERLLLNKILIQYKRSGINLS
jgi:Zn-dependent oligopeptidase